MADYISEFTLFMTDFLAKHPEIPEQQLQNRATLWDKTIDRDLERRFRESTVAQRPYVYQSRH